LTVVKWLFPFGIIGSILAGLFCGTMVTPLLVAVLAAIGAGFLDPDWAVFPTVIGFLIVAYIGWRARRRTPGNGPSHEAADARP
jgi:putative Ca2+/H+ antiporter (TMEM165/GDT1 family)